jgi:hypothetical protein
VCARVAATDEGCVVYLVNLLGKARAVRLVAEEAVGEVVDLISGDSQGPLFELQPLRPMLLRVHPPEHYDLSEGDR